MTVCLQPILPSFWKLGKLQCTRHETHFWTHSELTLHSDTLVQALFLSSSATLPIEMGTPSSLRPHAPLRLTDRPLTPSYLRSAFLCLLFPCRHVKGPEDALCARAAKTDQLLTCESSDVYEALNSSRKISRIRRTSTASLPYGLSGVR